jgi:hypothetical protein
LTQKWLHLPEFLPLSPGERLAAVIQEADTGCVLMLGTRSQSDSSASSRDRSRSTYSVTLVMVPQT